MLQTQKAGFAFNGPAIMEAAAEVDPDKHAILPEFLPDSVPVVPVVFCHLDFSLIL